MLISPDMHDVATDTPEDIDSFCVLLQALIGVDPDDIAADSFDIVVCTPDQLHTQFPKVGALSGHSFLFMKTWDIGIIRETIKTWCERSAAETWELSAAKLTRYMDWEYKD